MTSINILLKKLGISQNGRKIYHALLRYGPISAHQLSQKLDIPRSTVYFELDILAKYGLTSNTGRSHKRRYIAESPQILHELVDRKVNEYHELKKLALSASQEAQTLIQETYQHMPEIQYFYGIDGIKKALIKTLQAKSPIYGILPAFDIYKTVGSDFIKWLVAERVKRKIQVYNIWPEGKIPNELKRHKEQLRNIRFSKDSIDFRSSIITFDDYVILISSAKETFSVLIRSHDLSLAMKKVFTILWENADLE